MNMNLSILEGRLGGDPTVRYTQDGTPVANFNLATNERWTRNGEKQERVDWHRVVAFGKRAEVIGEYLSKGSRVLIEGKLRYRKFTADMEVEHNGEKITVPVTRTVAEVLLSNFTFLDARPGSSVSASADGYAHEGEQETPQQEQMVSEPEGDDPF